MKDFAKSIHVGNATIKFYGETINLSSESTDRLKEIYEELLMLHEGSDERKAIKEELKKRGVGNKKVENTEVVKDGDVWVVLYAEGTKSKEFDSEAEAKKFAAQVGNSFSDKVKFLFKDSITMSDSNGEKITIRKNGDVIRKAQPNNEFSQISIQHYDSGEKAIEEFKKKGFKVLNDTPAEYAKRPPKIVGGNSLPEELEKDVEKKDKEKVDYIEELKTGNAKDKNGKDIKIGDFVNVFGKKGKVTKIVGGDVVEVFFDNSGTYYPDRTDRYYDSDVVKVGNSIGGGVQSETVLTEAKDGSQYWVEKTSKSGQYAQYNLYYTIGQGKRHAGVFKDKESAADAGRRIIGNVKSEYEILKQDPSKMHPLYKKAYEEAMKKLSKEDEEFKKRFEREYGVKAKNEASDDKFAYVMREFEEGKLKTPDGKVVTDPAQAKAIAYSESKKTENGLARARNAMAKNKKVKNSAVREYKHSDGRVAQIDFNEDGSDADMSIYEGSKEIEQRNFSTIRDAEQYVTSHGFRRI